MFQVLSNFIQQTYCIPTPPLTEQNLPDQTGRVFIVTGGYAGVGFELSRFLHSNNATVHVAGRSAEKAEKSIVRIQQACPSSTGRLHFLKLDLEDLTSIKPAVESFLQREIKLDVLVNNAGIMFPAIASTSTQGHELQMATNCLGHFLLAQLLTPILQRTASSAPADTVRVLWAASFGVDALSPAGGVTFDNNDNFEAHKSNNQTNYGATKAGNYFIASQFARRYPIGADNHGIVNIAFNPGHLRTELQRHSGRLETWAVDKLFLNDARYGAYTELWCACSPSVTKQHNGAYAWPWGRFGTVRSDVQAELSDGKKAEQFWMWCEQETQAFI